MKRTRICELFGIEYPIIQAPMAWITRAELVAAVSDAGGLGTIGPMAGEKNQEEAKDLDTVEKRLREQIRKVKALTSKPFAVNFPIGWGKQKVINERRIAAALDEEIPIANVSMGSPEAFTEKLHDAGVKVIHIVTSVKHAKKAEKAGVDAVVCIGYEAGGHIGPDELPTFVLIPQVVDAVKIPVIAAGGIADVRGMVAAFALGAEGVYMGTRFLATLECNAHPNMKQAVVDANDTSTVAFGRRTGISRCIKNEYTKRHMELEASGAPFEEIREYERSDDDLRGWRRVPAALIDGNIEYGSVACGSIAGSINDIISAKEVIHRMADSYDEVIKRLKD
ncbi:MAG: nitronate monooxygenase [Thermodesulfobacteriota bacterium]|nr:nitronate monooxygenase [Thermodesulfobacteriota bacterium]